MKEKTETENTSFNAFDTKKKTEVKPEVKEKKQEPIKEEKTTVKVEDESKKNEKQDVDDDNLFDLIDSMYSEDN